MQRLSLAESSAVGAKGDAMTRRSIGIGLLAAWSGTALAAPGTVGATATATGSATATILAPIAVSHTPSAALNFGEFTAGSGGTVVVSPAGSGSATGAAALVLGSATTADAFAIDGDPNRGFAIVTAGGNVSFAGASMTFTTLPSAATGTLNSAGAAGFTIGGTLSVPANAAPGRYTGTYGVTVNYN